MSTLVTTPQSECWVGFAEGDITPPVGIYHRMWGAALHDRATGIHRPLMVVAMSIQSADRSGQQIIVSLDHCLLDRSEFEAIRTQVATKVGIPANDVHVAMTHAHGCAWMSRERAHLPGGDLIAPYLDKVRETCAVLAQQALQQAEYATIVYGTSRCGLARHRDYYDVERQKTYCGFNPEGTCDDTVLIGRVTSTTGKTLGTIVNYACHPTTLAWQNTLISPDYIGAMRELVEKHTGAPCLFLQGASGEVGPKEGFVGDTEVADRNGRELGFAALSGWEAIPKPGTQFEYTGPVISGAILGTWAHKPVSAEFANRSKSWKSVKLTFQMPYRLELPTMDETKAELASWLAEEAKAREANDIKRVSDCRAKAEQMTRQIQRLAALPTGKSYPFTVSLVRMGHAIWIFSPGELYQSFQTKIRAEFPNDAIVVSTITDDWQPGYIPAAEVYGYGIYQEIIAAVSYGSLEALTEAVCREIESALC